MVVVVVVAVVVGVVAGVRFNCGAKWLVSSCEMPYMHQVDDRKMGHAAKTR